MGAVQVCPSQLSIQLIRLFFFVALASSMNSARSVYFYYYLTTMKIPLITSKMLPFDFNYFSFPSESLIDPAKKIEEFPRFPTFVGPLISWQTTR